MLLQAKPHPLLAGTFAAELKDEPPLNGALKISWLSCHSCGQNLEPHLASNQITNVVCGGPI